MGKAEKAIERAAISEAAILELERLSLFLDAEFDVTASMSVEEIEDELREMGLDPDRPLPASISRLVGTEAGESQASNIRLAGERTDEEDLEPDNMKMPVYVYVSDERLQDECSEELKVLLLGIRHLGHQKRYAEALDLAKEATKLDPDYWRAWISLGTSLVLFGKVDDGEEIFQQVSKDFSSNPKAVAAGLHGCAWVKEIRSGLNPSADDGEEISRLYEEALQLDGSRANTRACLLIHRMMSDETGKEKELLEESVLCEGFFDALKFEINERGTTALSVLHELPTWLRYLMYPSRPICVSGYGY